MDPHSFSEHAQHLAALVEHAVSMHEQHGWAGPEHSTVDCALWAVGQFEAAHGETVTAQVVRDAVACTAGVRALLAGSTEDDGAPDATGDPEIDDSAARDHVEHADEVLAVLAGFVAERDGGAPTG